MRIIKHHYHFIHLFRRNFRLIHNSSILSSDRFILLISLESKLSLPSIALSDNFSSYFFIFNSKKYNQNFCYSPFKNLPRNNSVIHINILIQYPRKIFCHNLGTVLLLFLYFSAHNNLSDHLHYMELHSDRMND